MAGPMAGCLLLLALLTAALPAAAAAAAAGESCGEDDAQSLLQAYALTGGQKKSGGEVGGQVQQRPLQVGGGAEVPPDMCKVRPGVIVVLTGGRSGQYCRDAGDAVFCDSNTVTPLTRFEVVDAGDGLMAFRGPMSKGMCADEGPRLVCNRPWTRLWEWFTVKDYPNAVTIKGSRDNSYCTDSTLGVRCTQNVTGKNEMFGVQCVDKIPECRFTLTYALAAGDGIQVKTEVKPDLFDVQFCLDEACKDLAFIFSVRNMSRNIVRSSRLNGVLGIEETAGDWPAPLVVGDTVTLKFVWTATAWEIHINGVRYPVFNFAHRDRRQPVAVRVVSLPDCRADISIVKCAPATTTMTTTTRTTTTTTVTAIPCVMKPGEVVVFKGGRSGKYCRDLGNKIVCDSDKITQLEQFLVTDGGNGRMSLVGGKFGLMCANEVDSVKCDRRWNRLWEWLCVEQTQDYVTLKGIRNERYCSDTEAGVSCAASAPGVAEKFQLQCVKTLLMTDA